MPYDLVIMTKLPKKNVDLKIVVLKYGRMKLFSIFYDLVNRTI